MPAGSQVQGQLDFSFLMGLDGRTDPHSRQLGGIEEGINVVFDKTGALRKRPGNTNQGNETTPWNTASGSAVVGPTTVPGAPYGMLGFNDSEQLTLAGFRAYSYSPTQDGHVSKDDIPVAVGTRRFLLGSNAFQAGTPIPGFQTQTLTGYYNADMAAVGGFTCVVWQTVPGAGNISFAVFN